ncbi:retron Ec48 family effector membrane protein [Pseudomonas serboccidentalis]|uniref:retron Ec48 family effector membrane protein n=1 Tax=Pseudomonas serboccidentalis TaxID=2964670 RepID=UPI0039DFD348
MNYKKCLFIIAAVSFLVLIVIVLTSVFLSFAIAHRSALVFCFSPGCFDFAAKVFQEPIKIFKVGVAFAAYAFAAIGAATAILTYINSVRSEKYNRHIQKSSEFKKYTQELIAIPGSGIKSQNFNANKFYNCIFPRSMAADFSPSVLYVSIIEQMEALIVQSHKNFVPDDIGLFQEHYNGMLKYFQVLGISIEEPTEQRLIALEPKIFMFIDSVNKQFTGIELQLHCKPRDYSRLA